MKSLFLVGVLSFLILLPSAFALNITVSTDKTKILMGDNITLTGKITFDNGTTTAFQYRAAVVAPKRIIICDSNKTTTASDGTFTLNCKIPTADEANKLGIPAALTRSVIPYVTGVAVKDPVTNTTVKKHAKEIIAFNQDKLNRELDNIIQRVNEFINNSNRFLPECDAIAEKAMKFNITNVTSRCLEVQQKINDLITRATGISTQAQKLKSNVTAEDVKNLRDALKTLNEDQKDLRSALRNVKDAINSIRWEKLKEIKKSITEIRQDIEKKREEIKDLNRARSGR